MKIIWTREIIVYLQQTVTHTHKKKQVTDENLDERIEKFGVQIDDKYFYRIPLKYFCDLGKINFPTKIDLKIRCTLETEMKKLFESKKMLKQLKIGATAGSANANDYGPVISPGMPDAQIIFLKAPFIQYEQILLSKNFRQYLETIMLSSKLLRMGIIMSNYYEQFLYRVSISIYYILLIIYVLLKKI